MILERIPQRAQEDCSICAVAMVLGFVYEQVQADRVRFPADGRMAWWEAYLLEQGYPYEYRPLSDIYLVQAAGATVVGLVVLQHDQMRVAHIVAIDEVGVLDPSDGCPDHIMWTRYCNVRKVQGFHLDSEFLAVHCHVS